MSTVALEEALSVPLSLQPTKSTPGGNFNARLSTKPKYLRPDSPTTIQACNELGIMIDDLKQKSVEDFRDPKATEAIVQIRYNHYLKRYDQTVKDVTSRKKRIARKLKTEQLQQLQQEQAQFPQDTIPTSQTNLAASTKFIDNTTMMNSSNFLRANYSPQPSGFQDPAYRTFNKTISYFRTCHNTSEVRDLNQILGTEEGASSREVFPQLRTTFGDEVVKFNKAKLQKQKEAKDVYEKDLRRIKLIEGFKEKEKIRLEKQKLKVIERKKKILESRAHQEEKVELIKSLERNYRVHQREEREKMKTRLEEARKNAKREADEKRRVLAEKEREMELKMKEINEKRQKLQDEELMHCMMLKTEIEEKLNSNKTRHREHLNSVSVKVRRRLDRVEEEVEKAKKKHQLEFEEEVKNLVGKLVVKEENLRAYQEKHYKTMKKKEMENVERDKRHDNNQKDINKQYKERMKEINDRFKKVQENLEAKREHDDEQRKLKGEYNRLKLSDKLENHSRLQRRLAFEREKILDKERQDHEKLMFIKEQKEIVKLTKLEVAVQSKIERDRISEDINLLSKVVYQGNSSETVTDSQKKILKKVLQPSDFRAIEDQERRRDIERRIKAGELDEIASSGNMASSLLAKKK